MLRDTVCVKSPSCAGMYRGGVGLLILAVLLVVSAVPVWAESDQPSWMRKSRQLVVVTAPNWDSQAGMAQWYERGAGDAWQSIRGPVAVDLGRSGQGWGLGLHSQDVLLPGEPMKVEGDGKAPAGAFSLPYAFAYEPEQVAGTAMPVLDVDSDLFCVDDVESSGYNTTQRLQGGVAALWKSAEVMQRTDGIYRLGIFVGHNQDAPVPGRGSCIFMHIVKSDGAPTSGCTAMSEESLRALIMWLNPTAHPVLVQLPAPAYARLKGPWGLP